MSDGPTFARMVPRANNNNNNGNNRTETDGINLDPWVAGNIEGGTNDFTDNQIETWRERERRQRSVRSLMMLVLMMMLLDGEEQSQNRRQRQQQRTGGLRGSGNNRNRNIDNINSVETDMELYRARRTQDRSIEDIVLHGNHSRVNRLIKRNHGKDLDREIRDWIQEQRNIQMRAFYEYVLKDLVLEQPDGSYLKVLVASASNNEAVTVAEDPSKILHDAASPTNDEKSIAKDSESELKAALKKFDEFQDDEQEVWHYPWNATGYYRGDWKIIDKKKSLQHDTKAKSSQNNSEANILTPVEAETYLLEHLQSQADPYIGVHLLPPGMEILRSTNGTSSGPDISRRKIDSIDDTNPNFDNDAFFVRGASRTKTSSSPLPAKLSLTKTSGKVAFQLYSKAVPSMKELSLIDGYVKICDSNTAGYSSSRDILLRVHGVLVHSLGRLSLIANPRSTRRAALLINNENGVSANTTAEDATETETGTDSVKENERGRRRLKELLPLTTHGEKKKLVDAQMNEIRTHALELFHTTEKGGVDLSSYKRIRSTGNDASIMDYDLHEEYIILQQSLETNDRKIDASMDVLENLRERRRRLDEVTSVIELAPDFIGKEDVKGKPVPERSSFIDPSTSDKKSQVVYSKYVVPFPFAWDDQQKSLQRNRAPSSVRLMVSQEKSLEINAGSCEFEINMDVQEEKWTVAQLKKLMSKQTEHELTDGKLDMMQREFYVSTSSRETNSREDIQKNRLFQKSSGSTSSRPQKRTVMEQAWVMTFNGTIVSPNCNFEASFNSTANRIDWETTTGKAINYSFYMMAICLTQIVLLLRQLLHTQSQSASARVSLLCIGWQTVIDALLCLVHIYLSLAMQHLFTAFASVAFFKLLIFCVIEMKYMAIIIQARNASNGGNSVELLRRQIAMLNVRFYVALMGSCLGFFYSNNYRTMYILILYSFWVPQIIHNVVTEAKKPMHSYYVCGTSMTRLVAPLYMFANEGNFLKQIYPEIPINIFMCKVLVLWLGVQAGVLYAQSRFGARFFIPAQFLPPKYDYNRPIPASLLTQENEVANPSEQLQIERDTPKTEVRPLVVPNRCGGARNRKEGKRMKEEAVMTAETLTEVPKSSTAHCIECVICYTDIDTSDRTAYMIAPCNHVFHKECLIQWMEVKMECPVCRQNLPAL